MLSVRNDFDVILSLRMASHRLHHTELVTGAETVRWFGAMQAQDQNMCRWAASIRAHEHHTAAQQAIDNGQIIRIHVLRPTWHLVHVDDVRHFLRLTAPRIRTPLMTWARKMGVDARALLQYNKQIAQLLQANGPMSRTELVEGLGARNKALGEYGASILLMNAELDEVICNAPMQNKETAYTLMDSRVPATQQLAVADALHVLAVRYFTSHGPATLADFTWWSGLSVADARKAFQSVLHIFDRIEVAGVTYLYKGAYAPETIQAVRLLPSFDEYIISYKDRSAAIDACWQPLAITRNAIFKPVLIAGGRVVAIWSRTVKKDTTTIQLSFFEQPQKHWIDLLPLAAAQYALSPADEIVCKW